MLAAYSAPEAEPLLGGDHAYVSQTRRVATRLSDQLRNIQNDPNFLGRATERFIRAVPNGVERLEIYVADPLKGHDRINFQACMIALTAGEVAASLDTPLLDLSCGGEKLRSAPCRAKLERNAIFAMAFNRHSFVKVCPWTK